jgi:hypothetical protein
MRWARREYGTGLKYAIDRASGERTIRSWDTGTDTSVWAVWDCDGFVTVKAETLGHLEAGLYTQDVSRILGCLADLGVIPARFSPMFRLGQLAGQTEMADDLDLYATVIAAGEQAWQQAQDGGQP